MDFDKFLGSKIETEPYMYYPDILKAINEFNQTHSTFCRDYPNLLQKNLKKTQVKEVHDDNKNLIDDFYNIITEYMRELNKSIAIVDDFRERYDMYDGRTRGKAINSIVYKLHKYHFQKGEKGEIPINKCLNDLYGARIVIPNFDHECKLLEEICKYFFKQSGGKSRIKFNNATKNGYKATHIYFMGENNRCYPWELQIWNANDFDSNEKQHEIHKQEYTKWEEEYNKSKEIEYK